MRMPAVSASALGTIINRPSGVNQGPWGWLWAVPVWISAVTARVSGSRRLTVSSPITDTHRLPSPGLVITCAGEEPTLAVARMSPDWRSTLEITWSNQWVTYTLSSASFVPDLGDHGGRGY
jgi:hypothetical protein